MRRPPGAGIPEALMFALAVAIAIGVSEAIAIASLEGGHTVRSLYGGLWTPALGLGYAALFAGPALLVALAARLLTRNVPAPGSATRWLVGCSLALPSLNAALVGPIDEGLRQPAGFVAAASTALVCVVGAFVLARRGNETTLRWATVGVVCGSIVLASLVARVLLTPAGGVAGILEAAGLGGGVGMVLCLPIALALRSAGERPVGGRIAAAAILLAAVQLAIVFGPSARQGQPTHPRPAPGAPSVLLVVIDTLRADFALGARSGGLLVPELTRLASDGVVFERAYSTSAWTTPAIGSLLTSSYPAEHRAGVRDPRSGLPSALDAQAESVAEILAERGYFTGAVTTNAQLRRGFGFERGFLVYENLLSPWLQHPILTGLLRRGWFRDVRPYLDAEFQSGRAWRLLERARASGRPFFLMAHYMDPHRPYAAPDRETSTDTTPKSVRYAEEVHYTDRHLGALLDQVREAGLYRELLIVVTADHGEELNEDRFGYSGRLDHGHSLFQELIHIPLIVKRPGNLDAGLVRREDVSLVDVAPTLLRELAIEVPEGFRGRSLFDPEAGRAPPRVLFAEALRYGSEQKAAIQGSRKVILFGDPGTAAQARVFDLDLDPQEQHPAPLPTARGRTRELFEELSRHVRLGRAPRATTQPAQVRLIEREQLEALGYIEEESRSDP